MIVMPPAPTQEDGRLHEATREVLRKIQRHDNHAYLVIRAALRQYALPVVPEKLILIKEVNPMDLSAEAIQLAHLYMETVEQQECGNFDNGYTATELDAKRTRLHNKLIAALARCRVDTSDRADTTELARRIMRWMPD